MSTGKYYSFQDKHFLGNHKCTASHYHKTEMCTRVHIFVTKKSALWDMAVAQSVICATALFAFGTSLTTPKSSIWRLYFLSAAYCSGHQGKFDFLISELIHFGNYFWYEKNTTVIWYQIFLISRNNFSYSEIIIFYIRKSLHFQMSKIISDIKKILDIRKSKQSKTNQSIINQSINQSYIIEQHVMIYSCQVDHQSR